jgi:uncharacterized spore protein YtfJ
MKKVLCLVLLFCTMAFSAQAQATEDAGTFPAIDLSTPLRDLNGVLTENLDSGSCLGTPIQAAGHTIIPILCKGFGFGIGGGVKSAEEGDVKEKSEKDKQSFRHGLGGGGGGGLRPIALIVISPDQKLSIHRLSESFAAQLAKQIVPVLQNLISRVFEFRKFDRELHEKSQSGPAAPTKP